MPIIMLDYFKEKWKHSGFQKYLKNMSWIFSIKILSMAVSFIATAYIARNLGPSNYGQLSYALSYIGLFGFLSALGIDQVLYRDLVKYPNKKDTYIGTAIYLRTIASIFTILLCTLIAYLFSSSDVSIVLIFLLSLTFIFNTFQLLSYEFQAEAKSKYTTTVSLIIVILLNILKIIVICKGKGVIYLASIILLEPILYAVGFLYFRIKVYGSIKNLSIDFNIAKSMIKDSLPLMFASAFASVYSRIDQVMIKNMIDSTSVGLYDSAVRISELWYFVPSIIVGSLFPAIINARNTSPDLYYIRIKKLLLTLISISALTTLPTALFSKYFILIIFGPSFINALPILNVYIFSNIGACLTLITQHILIIENKSKIILITTFCGMVTNVLLNFYLIPIYGSYGAAIATLISYFIPFLSLFLFNFSRNLLKKIYFAKLT